MFPARRRTASNELDQIFAAAAAAAANCIDTKEACYAAETALHSRREIRLSIVCELDGKYTGAGYLRRLRAYLLVFLVSLLTLQSDCKNLLHIFNNAVRINNIGSLPTSN